MRIAFVLAALLLTSHAIADEAVEETVATITSTSPSYSNVHSNHWDFTFARQGGALRVVSLVNPAGKGFYYSHNNLTLSQNGETLQLKLYGTQSNPGFEMLYFIMVQKPGEFTAQRWNQHDERRGDKYVTVKDFKFDIKESDFGTAIEEHPEFRDFIAGIFRSYEKGDGLPVGMDKMLCSNRFVDLYLNPEKYEPSAKLVADIKAKIKLLDAEDFRVREGASNALTEMGDDAALYLIHRKGEYRDGLSAEQHSRIDAVIARYPT